MKILQQYGIETPYVVHALRNKEYKKRLEKIFGDMSFDFELMSEGDISKFTDELIQKYFSPDVQIYPQGGISCTLNHFLCYEKIVARGEKLALIFEDDVFFVGDFISNIKPVIEEASSLDQGFIISLENSTLEFPSFWSLKKGKRIYEAKMQRCTGGYLIDLKCATEILKYTKENKCFRMIDEWHNYLVEKDIIKLYWAHPILIEQGSHNGLLGSALSLRKKGSTRRVKWLLQKFYKMYILHYLR